MTGEDDEKMRRGNEKREEGSGGRMARSERHRTTTDCGMRLSHCCTKMLLYVVFSRYANDNISNTRGSFANMIICKSKC